MLQLTCSHCSAERHIALYRIHKESKACMTRSFGLVKVLVSETLNLFSEESNLR